MNELVKRLKNILQIEYITFIILALLFSFAYEIGWLEEGRYATDVRMQYILESIGIIVATCFVPLALKLFGWVMEKKIRKRALTSAIKLYRLMGEIRLMLLALVVFINIYVYYATLDNIGGLCALIGVTASLFCLPSAKKIESELDLTKNTEE